MLPYPSFLNAPLIPETVGETDAHQQFFSYSKDIALAVDRMSRILHYFFLILITGFFGAVYQVIKASGYLRKEEQDKK